MNEIKFGDKIQDFTLKDQSQKKVHLYDFAGKKVLLSFHPLAWTSVCSEQMKLLEENHEMFDRLNTVAFGISVDPAPSKKAWNWELRTSNFFRISGLMGRLPENMESSGKKKESLRGLT